MKVTRSKPRNKEKTGAREPVRAEGRRPPWFTMIVLVLLLVDLYLLATLFLFRTGDLGRIVHFWTLEIFGGGVIVLLLFGAYSSISWLMGYQVPSPWRQALASLIMYLCCALLLGLSTLSGIEPVVGILRPGRPGYLLAGVLLRHIGPFGAVLAGFGGMASAMVLYGIINRRNVAAAASLLSGVLRSFCALLSPLSGGHPAGTAPSQEGTKKTPGKTAPETVTKTGRTSGSATPGKIDIPDTIVDETAVDKVQNLSDTIPGKTLSFPIPLDVFGEPDDFSFEVDKGLLSRQGENIVDTLEEFGISAELAETVVGPTVIQYRIQLAPGIKVSRVSSLANDLAVSLAVPSLRVEAPIPGKTYIGIEIPNPDRKPVNIRTVLEHSSFQDSDSDLAIPVGVGVDGRHLTIGLEKMPHLLVAGTTGSGKSVFVSCCIAALACRMRPEELRFLLIDPKRVEMKVFERLPHNITPPVVESRQAVHALGWAIREMEKRYEMFAQARVRNIKAFNARALPLDRLPYIIIVIDELADLMFTSPREVEDYICRLAQMARATGIHLVIATQRPSVNVVTGLIKANIPARVAFTLPSQTDSRTIIDVSGAERLLGSGDMLFLTPRLPKPLRIQSPWMDEPVIQRFMEYLSALFGDPVFLDIDMQEDDEQDGGRVHLDDPLLEEAMGLILQSGIASASRLQRQLRIGFTRAARLIDTLEQVGILGPQEGSRPRDILVDEEEARQILGASLNTP
ncbi:MAG: DNA translocase FtsK [Thermovirgaceae bacterium]|jgi:S-DNA-T family DNA segregation ATPase FtsK/SpoIIIE|nr:DNA translocase FtsK [Synergistales bacterium]MDI9391990.1 DNA translocase FtsK [Synergistota bacterium]MDY0179229.1 DNA translocase FtsK [Synergistaceae bacterium]HRW87962.1 DNA translocase FtsK [Thermovirgaceae bacterium]MDD3829405.1 DNA translocase FtsK [Synergistales bacterium]